MAIKRIVATVLCAIVLTGCSPIGKSGSGESFESVYTREVIHRLSDGRVLTCITYKSGYGGGISCDWENAKVR